MLPKQGKLTTKVACSNPGLKTIIFNHSWDCNVL